MTTRQGALALGVVGGMGAILALYYLVHKPVTPAEAAAGAQTLVNLAVAAALVSLGGGVGRRLLRLWLGEQPAELSAGERVLLEVALGWGVLGLGLLALGLARLYYPVAAWLLAAGLLAWQRRDVGAWWAGLAAALRSPRPSGRLAWVAAAFAGLMLGLGLVRALAPPVTWDALVYHLTLPALYARTHDLQVNTTDFNLFSGMPQLTEMLYTAAGLLRVDAPAGAITAQALGWSMGALLCLGLAASAQSLGLRGWLAPAILFSSLSIAEELAWAYADLLLMLLALAALVALRQWRRERDAGHNAGRWLLLGGVFAGLACGCKYTGVIVPMAAAGLVAGVVLLGTSGSRRARLVEAVKSSAAIGLAAGAAFAPWLAKNWLLTGSPVYPLLWPAADMDALRQWFYNRPDQAEPLLRAAGIFGRATFVGVQGGNEIDATLGPLLFGCAILLVFDWHVLGRELRRELALWLLFVAVAYLGWVVLARYSALAHQARLFFAFLPALALVGAAGLDGLRGLDVPSLRLSMVVGAAIALVLVLSATEVAIDFAAHDPLPYVAGVQTAADYTAAQLGWYEPALASLNALPAGSRVVFLWEARSFACASTIRCVPDVVIDRWWHARRTEGGAERIVAQWRAEGTTHVLIYDTGARFVEATPNNAFDPTDWAELDRLRGQLRPLATFGDAYTLYAMP